MGIEKNILTIGYDKEFADTLGLVDNQKTKTLIQTKLAELGHTNLHVRFIVAEAPPRRVRPPEPSPVGATASPAAAATPQEPRTPATAGPARIEDFKNDPLIKQALEIFKGQIVDVRV